MMCDIGNMGVYITYTYTYVLDMYFNSVGSSQYLRGFSLQMIKSISSTCSARHRMQVVDIISNSFNHIVAFISVYIDIYVYIYGMFPKCLFPESIVWYVLMGSHFLFNSFLIIVPQPIYPIYQFMYKNNFRIPLGIPWFEQESGFLFLAT